MLSRFYFEQEPSRRIEGHTLASLDFLHSKLIVRALPIIQHEVKVQIHLAHSASMIKVHQSILLFEFNNLSYLVNFE